MRRLVWFAVAALAGCSMAPTPVPAFPAELNLENRGGPAFVVNINGSDVVTVECNVGVYPLAPGNDSLSALPWHLRVARQRDGRIIYEGEVTKLPLWLVQIGEDIGLGSTAVAGPPGPTCPPPS